MSRPDSWLRRVTRSASPALLLTLFVVTAVWAHAEFLRGDPAPGAVLPLPPRAVRMWFNESIEAPADAVTVLGPDGVRVDGRDARVAPEDKTSLQVSMSAQAQGTYSVRWRAVSADGHPISGTYRFSVGAPSTGAAPVETVGNGASGLVLQSLARWTHLLGLVLALGPAIFGLAVLRGLDAPATTAARAGRLSYWGAVLLLPAALLMLASQGIQFRGSVREGLELQTLVGLLATHWGRLWIARTVVGIGLLVVAYRARKMSDIASGYLNATLGLGAAAIALTSLNGHSGSTDPIWLSVTVDWIHMASTAAWTGGLLTLWYAFLPGTASVPPAERSTILGRAIPRFSMMAFASIELLVFTGLYHTWAHVDGPGQLVTSGYGIALLLKLAVIAVALTPAAFNRLVLRPQFAAAQARKDSSADNINRLARTFGRTVAIEGSLAVLVLAVVGLLTALPPATGPSRAAAASGGAQGSSSETLASGRGEVTLAQNAGSALATVSVDPAQVGANRLSVMLQDSTGAQMTGAEVRVRIVPPTESGISPSTSAMALDDGDRYRATVSLTPAGRWVLQFLVSPTPRGKVDTAAVGLTVPVFGAAELLAFADETMNRLTSVVQETESSAGKTLSSSRIEYQAPDRMRRLDAKGAVQDVLIGTTRHMHHGEMWHSESVEPFRWPDYRLAAAATEVVLLGREKLNGAECFVVGFVDTRDGSRNRVWISADGYRIVQQSSMAPGQFTVARLSHFNQPLTIKAPAGP